MRRRSSKTSRLAIRLILSVRAAPLRAAEDAHHIDSSALSVEEVIAAIIALHPGLGKEMPATTGLLTREMDQRAALLTTGSLTRKSLNAPRKSLL